ncbi:cyclin-dependent kinase inhibitor 1-like [Brienomyrus brachyistius]|uniref:cyclin-dependent kinase inhibitor 1-like n=1 Tax=Brienomyrus brachyistius TaxID=42636 RepID=UPI0020B17E58|nr:cyclin-dependent kinase inhibitor 1-like [Brienomyrus brachyistius]
MSSEKNFPMAHGKGQARRRLFGPVDHELLQVDYQTALNRELEDARRRWGFDFLTETPLEGSCFIWEGVSGSMLPSLYRSSRIPQETGLNIKENVSRIPERYISRSLTLEQTSEKNQAGKMKRKQTSITDFYKSKRRMVATPRKSGQ